jgi:1-acyl-sn-glycerol-3-phosphate acyltransferase
MCTTSTASSSTTEFEIGLLSWLRALLWIDPLAIAATAVMGSVNLVVALWDDEGRQQLRVARAWGRMLLGIAGVKVKVIGIEKVDPSQSYVVVGNHVSYMDTPVLLSHIPVNFRFMAKQGLFDVPFIGGHLKKAGHIPVPRDDPRSALKVLSSAGKAMKERGLSVLVFPEGGRSEDGELRPFKDGAAYLAIKGGVPLLPICLIGMHDILPMHSIHVRPGRVTLRIGNPIPSEGLVTHNRAALTEQLFESIAQLQAQGR